MKRLAVVLCPVLCGSLALAASGGTSTVVSGGGSCDQVSATVRRATQPDPATSRRLAALFTADQQDRMKNPIDWDRVVLRDRDRRLEVERLIRARKLFRAADFYHAAMIFQHGNCPAHYRHAQQLADQAVRLGSAPARWLYAATTDRLLRSQNLPQKYGTQYTCEGTAGKFDPYDPKTTDAERARYNVLPLAESLKRAETICR